MLLLPLSLLIRVLSICAVFCVAALALLLPCFFLISNDSYLYSLADSTNTIQNSGLQLDFAVSAVSIAGIVSEDVIAYVKGSQAEMRYSSYFRPEEVSHLADVRHKVRGFQLFFYSVLAAAVVIFSVVFAIAKSIRKFVLALNPAFFAAGAAAVAVSVSLFILSLNFDSSFTAFHKLFFAGSQWQFPSSYLLVNLFTADFFAGIARAVVAAAFVEGLALMLASFVIGKFYNPKAPRVKA